MDILLVPTIFLVTLIAILGGYFKYKVSPLIGKKLPPGSSGLPFVGETSSFLKSLKKDKTFDWIAKRVTKYGPVFQTSLMGSKVIVITGQAGNRFMFSGGDNSIVSNQPISAATILGKNSIFEISGHRHRLVRGAIMNFLKPESLQRFVGKMDSLVKQQLSQELFGKHTIKAVTMMKKITFNVTCNLLFGLPEDYEKDKLFDDFTMTIKGMWSLPFDFPGTMFRKAVRARGRICKLLSELINKRRKEMEEGKMGNNQEDVISTFLALRDENGEPLPQEEIIDDMITLIIASHDTNTIVLSLLVRHLARDAEVCKKVLKEQEEVSKAIRSEGSEGMLGWNEMQMMKYTWRVAQELMRITPPAFGNFKRASRDTSFGGFDIPKGWQVFWVTSPTHMDNNIFEEPEKFDPSRFENPTKTIPPYVYIPFGAGPRGCPGAEFARIEVLLIIHHLITTYRWTEMIPNEPLTREPMVYPAMGLPIKLYPRKTSYNQNQVY